MRSNLKRTAQNSDGEFITAGDYSLMIQDLPSGIKQANIIYEHFNKLSPVHSVLLCYDNRECATLQKELDEAVVEYYIAIECERVSAEFGDTLDAEGSRMLQQKLLETITRCNRMHLTPEERIVDFTPLEGQDLGGCFTKLRRFFGFKKDKFFWRDKILKLLEKREEIKKDPKDMDTTRTAFVTFVTSQGCKGVLGRYNTETKYSIFGAISEQPAALSVQSTPVTALPCVEPSDVQFHNLGYSYVEIFFRTFVMDFVTLVLVGLGILFMFLINDQKTQTSSFVLSLALSVIVTALTSVIQFVVPLFTPFTKPITHTYVVSSSLFRIMLASFAVSTFAPFIFSVFDSTENDNSARVFFMSYQWFYLVGVSFMFNIIVDIVKTSFMELTHIVHRILVLLPAWLFAESMPQDEINRSYYPPEWKLELRMAHMVKTVLSGLLISSFMPAVVPLLALYFAVQYWVDKYSLLRWYKAPSQYSFEIVMKAQMYLLVGFHIHCIVKIISYILSTYVNMPNAPSHYYTDGALFAAFYFVFCLVLLIYYIRSGCKNGFISRGRKQTDSDQDETGGKPFALFENFIETYLDKHPCYNEDDSHRMDEEDMELYKVAMGNLQAAPLKIKSDKTPTGRLTVGLKQGVDTAPYEEFTYYSYYSQATAAGKKGGSHYKRFIFRKPPALSGDYFNMFGITPIGKKGRKYNTEDDIWDSLSIMRKSDVEEDSAVHPTGGRAEQQPQAHPLMFSYPAFSNSSSSSSSSPVALTSAPAAAPTTYPAAAPSSSSPYGSLSNTWGGDYIRFMMGKQMANPTFASYVAAPPTDTTQPPKSYPYGAGPPKRDPPTAQQQAPLPTIYQPPRAQAPAETPFRPADPPPQAPQAPQAPQPAAHYMPPPTQQHTHHNPSAPLPSSYPSHYGGYAAPGYGAAPYPQSQSQYPQSQYPAVSPGGGAYPPQQQPYPSYPPAQGPTYPYNNQPHY